MSTPPSDRKSALYMPLRAALTVVTHDPELAPILKRLWPDKVLSRFETAKQLAAG